jgi:hypothetical protein
LFVRGMSVRQVKQALGISHGEAGRLRLRAAAEGFLSGGREEDDAEEAESAADEPYRPIASVPASQHRRDKGWDTAKVVGAVSPR